MQPKVTFYVGKMSGTLAWDGGRPWTDRADAVEEAGKGRAALFPPDSAAVMENATHAEDIYLSIYIYIYI